MTVCIAAICETLTDTPKITFASDRLITAGVVFEGGVSKCQPLTPNCWVMASSNNATVSDGLIQKIQNNLKLSIDKKEITSIEEIATTFSKECKNKIKNERERQVYSLFGVSEKEFNENSIKTSELVVRDVLDKLREFKYEFEFEFLVFGFDVPPLVERATPHIYKIDQFGEIETSDHIGFAMTGSGSFLAFPEMTKYPYAPTIPLSDSVLRVYWSKKIAERVQGVGNQTDLAVLFASPTEGVRIWQANPELKDYLDKKLNEIKTFEGTIITQTLAELTQTTFAPPKNNPEPPQVTKQ